MLVVAGFVILFTAGDSLRWDGWAMCVGAGLAILLLNVLYRYGAKGDHERDDRGRRARVLRPSTATGRTTSKRHRHPSLYAVPFSVQLGLFFALLTALGSIVGFFLKHKGAVQAPPVEWRRPLHSTIALFRSPIYTLGCVVATTSWGFHVLALGLAPISVVQSVIAGGLVLVTVVADRVFGHSVTRREWIGVALTAAGLAFLAATLEGTADAAHADYDSARPLRDRRRRHARRRRPRQPQPQRPRAGGLRRPAVGGQGHHDQGADAARPRTSASSAWSSTRSRS